MSHFFAEFDVCGTPACVIRKDTRVYYHPQAQLPNRGQDKCVGAVWMCNPGSAAWPPTPAPWGPIQGDPTLWRVLQLYQKAVAVKHRPTAVGSGDYIAILNCFYAVDPDPDAAFDAWRISGCQYDESICGSAAFLVVAWGLSKPHGPVFKAMKNIESWGRTSSGQVDPPELVVCVDPTLPEGSSKISRDVTAVHYPAHPGSRAFVTNMDELATALSPYILGGDPGPEGVLDLEE